jgi:hypothetical protein
MKELRMANGDVEDAERMPWCPDCECFAVPTDAETCGECGAPIEYREGEA